MRLWDYLDKRRQDRQKRLDDVLDREYQIRQQNIDGRTEIIKEVIKNPVLGMPFRNLDLKSNDQEPFGWPPGTVRGMITIFIVLSYCIVFMADLILKLNILRPEWHFSIVMLVIGSYFYTRWRMNI